MNAYFILIISFIALLWSANHLVVGASGITYHFKVPPLIIGLTIVAFGTSAPEIGVAISAALAGHTNLAIGNAIGSNIANIGLVLGITTLLSPPMTTSNLLKREYPLLFVIMLFTYALIIDGYLNIIDGCLMLLGTIALILYFGLIAKKSMQSYKHHAFLDAINLRSKLIYSIVNTILGLVILPISAHYLVSSAVDIAKILGVSETIIGLSVIAIGTSLPEVATSIVAAVKGETDIAIGNILGSNMFNLITVLIFPGIINPSPVAPDLIWRDMPIMFAITIVLLLINYFYKQRLTRWHGGVLLFIYITYIVYIV